MIHTSYTHGRLILNSLIEIFSTMFQIDRFNSRTVELLKIVLVTDPYRECMGKLITDNVWAVYTELKISRFVKHFH